MRNVISLVYFHRHARGFQLEAFASLSLCGVQEIEFRMRSAASLGRAQQRSRNVGSQL